MSAADAPRVLIAGETWISFGSHIKGFNAFTTGSYAEGLTELVAALHESGSQVTHVPNHLATTTFPMTMAELERFDVVILSDIGADTLQLHPDTFDRGQRTTDRLQLLADFTAAGHGLLMVGGYLSFSGFEGKARYQNTALAGVLPVSMLGYDDSIRSPCSPTSIGSSRWTSATLADRAVRWRSPIRGEATPTTSSG